MIGLSIVVPCGRRRKEQVSLLKRVPQGETSITTGDTKAMMNMSVWSVDAKHGAGAL